MQRAAKKRPSFAGARSALREKENKAKSYHVPTATVLPPFSGSTTARKWPAGRLRYFITREERKAPRAE